MDTAPRTEPELTCDVVMKGGITSGVVYPRALRVLGTTYRFKGIGGASAGAIGAMLGAAAELGRAQGGFDLLDALPGQLGDGRLADLFQPQRRTRKLLGLMLVATGSDRAGPPRTGLRKVLAIVWRLVTSFPIAGLLGVLPGAALAVVGAWKGGLAGWLLFAVGLFVALLGWVLAVVLRLVRLFTVDVPANRFGICSGLSTQAGRPGFTDWLSDRADALAGLPAGVSPLTFGQLWRGPHGTGDADHRDIDLRLITTCLTEGTPFEMPFEARRFFFDPAEWRQLFPGYVVDALERSGSPVAVAGAPVGEPTATTADPEWDWEDQQALAQHLRRLPPAADLPVIVATRMSLSFPLLISAVPLYTINRRDKRNQDASARFREGGGPALVFSRVWFTDGGLCSNFPVQLFDAALSSRPTFAINLGQFPAGMDADPSDQTKNLEWAKTNSSGILPPHMEMAEKGLKAVTGFASAAINTARNWSDNSQLTYPGYRDRIVRVMQTKLEGGMNLRMSGPTIDALAERGAAAGSVMVEQFTMPHYTNGATGWDNHRWVRYRALLSVLPDWLRSYQRGFSVLAIDPKHSPSYTLDAGERALAESITTKLNELAAAVEAADRAALAGLVSAPRPQGKLRRVPQI